MEKAAMHVPPSEGGRSLWILGELLTYKVASDQTGGAYALFEVATRPGMGSSPHIQHREDECFYVLEGEYEFLVEGCTIRARDGSLVYVPKGNLHAHENAGEGTGRMLVSQTPGGLYERFFEEVGKPADDDAGPLVVADQSDMTRIVNVAARYGIEIPPPTTQKAWPTDYSETMTTQGTE